MHIAWLWCHVIVVILNCCGPVFLLDRQRMKTSNRSLGSIQFQLFFERPLSEPNELHASLASQKSFNRARNRCRNLRSMISSVAFAISNAFNQMRDACAQAFTYYRYCYVLIQGPLDMRKSWVGNIDSLVMRHGTNAFQYIYFMPRRI